MHHLVLAAAIALVTALPAGAQAQVMASEHGMVQQRVDGTTITIEYYRPQRRGRDNLFGGVVKWGSTWTPGANWATTLDVDHDVLHRQPRALAQALHQVTPQPAGAGLGQG